MALRTRPGLPTLCLVSQSSGQRSDDKQEFSPSFLWGLSPMRFTGITLTLLAFAFVGACASGRATRPVGGGDQYLIKAEELETARRSTNLYDALRELRPFWFTRHVRMGDAITVYYDDQRVGGATLLQRFSIGAAGTVRYLSPTEAQVRYGPTHPSGPVIAIESHRKGN